MLKHEKKAFWKFFSVYFGSVAILILASGFFYFTQQKKSLIEKEHFSMIEYTRELKMNLPPSDTQHISHEIKNIVIKDFNMNNFEIQKKFFLKYMPYSWSGGYLLIKKDKIEFYNKLSKIKLHIIFVQIALLALFATLSYILAIRALKPMQEAITKLDNFSKDLIHDLNTPITSILLNMKLLDTKGEFKNNKALFRIKSSAKDIGELHNNLTLLLQEDTMMVQNENIFEIVNELVNTQNNIYKDIQFTVEDKHFYAKVNKDALKQILINIISNACKYNKQNGVVKIYSRDKVLFVEDSGIGIKEPKKIFERSYKEQQSGHGIGLDITKRLCDAMGIKIGVTSKIGAGSVIFLKMKE